MVVVDIGVQSRRDSNGETITITDRWYVARDESTGVASQGETKIEAIANLTEALELHARPAPESDEETEPSTAPWL
ncbi:type II toxin-antitoxin system HicB family antitoxin [Natrinema caseinilyticum]|uniref:type II toxin-antitoxin system HicB family antitoxin n=1 Tax=Natrinema caseinilyticum TaxID=2961570 RepID=UPI003CCC9790